LSALEFDPLDVVTRDSPETASAGVAATARPASNPAASTPLASSRPVRVVLIRTSVLPSVALSLVLCSQQMRRAMGPLLRSNRDAQLMVALLV
jgi:hypothetical protein